MLLDILDKEITETPQDQGQSATSAGRASYEQIMSFATCVLPEGIRNNSMTKFAGFLRARGLEIDMITAIMKSINKTTSANLPDKEIETLARSVSRYQPKPEVRIAKCSDILNMAQAREVYYRERKLWGYIKTGFERLDKWLFAMLPGDVLTIAGRSGSGKTNIGLQLLNGMSLSVKKKGLFCSLEMGAGSVFFRLANVWLSKAKQEPTDAKQTADYLGSYACDDIVQYWDSLVIMEKDSQTVQQIEEHLINAKEKFGDIPLIAIDYIGYLRDTQAGSNYEKVSRIAKDIKGLAKRQNIKIILLCQTSREGEDGTVPVKLHHLRDSGSIEESADYCIGIWQDSIDDTRLHCELLKGRAVKKGQKMDFINEGLNLIEDDYQEEKGKKWKQKQN